MPVLLLKPVHCLVKEPDPSHHGSGFSFDADQSDTGNRATIGLMAGIDWAYVLSVAVPLALAIGATCALLFAMYYLESNASDLGQAHY